MSLRDKLATGALCVGSITALAGMSSVIYNGLKYNAVQDEAADRLSRRDRQGPVFLDNHQAFYSRRSLNPRTNAEIDSDSFRYRDNGLMGLYFLVGGLVVAGAGLFVKKE